MRSISNNCIFIYANWFGYRQSITQLAAAQYLRKTVKQHITFNY